MDFRRFLGEQETKNGAQYLKPSAEMVRVYSSWSAARDGTSSRGSGAHLGCKIRRPLQVMDGCKRAWNSGELDGARWKKKVMEAAEDYLESCANVKVYIQTLERLMEPENREISPRYILKYSTRGGSNIFQRFGT